MEHQLLYVQANRWKHAVGRREVAEIRGSLIPNAMGVLITASNYAHTAVVEAERPLLMPISLVDGFRFAAVTLKLQMEVS